MLVHDEEDFLAAYLAPTTLRHLVAGLAPNGDTTAWTPQGYLAFRGLPDAGEAIDGRPRCALPTSLRTNPEAALDSGHEWVVCVEDGEHAVLYTRRPEVVARAVHVVLQSLLTTPAQPHLRVDPRLIGMLTQPASMGAHCLSMEPLSTGDRLHVHSPLAKNQLSMDASGVWRVA